MEKSEIILKFVSGNLRMNNNNNNNSIKRKKIDEDEKKDDRQIWDFGCGNTWKTQVSKQTEEFLELCLSSQLNDFKINICVGIDSSFSLYCSAKEIYMSDSTYLKSLFDAKDFDKTLNLDKTICSSVSAVVIVLYLLYKYYRNIIPSLTFAFSVIENQDPVISDIIKVCPEGATVLSSSLMLAHYLGLPFVEKEIINKMKTNIDDTFSFFDTLRKTKNEKHINPLVSKYLTIYSQSSESSKKDFVKKLIECHSHTESFVSDVLNRLTDIRRILTDNRNNEDSKDKLYNMLIEISKIIDINKTDIIQILLPKDTTFNLDPAFLPTFNFNGGRR